MALDQLNTTGSWLATQRAGSRARHRYEYCVDCSCADKNHGAIHTAVADDNGRGNLRPGWEILFNHYAKVKKLDSGYRVCQDGCRTIQSPR